LQQCILQTQQHNTTMPPNTPTPTAAPDLNRGNSATVTMSREGLNALSGDDLRDLCRKKGLAIRGARGALVNRLLKGKKKAPKSNAERQATHKANRSDAKKEEDTARNTEHKTSSRKTRSEAKKEEDRASNAMGMAALRGDENHRLKENERERLRKTDWRKVPENCEKEKARKNERRADGTSDLDKIKDLTRGDLTTRLWKRPGFDWHTENHEQHWQAALCKLYLCAGIGWNEDKAAIVRVKELQEQCEHGEISKEEKLARFVFDTFDNGSKEEIDEMERVLKNIFGTSKVGQHRRLVNKIETSKAALKQEEKFNCQLNELNEQLMRGEIKGAECADALNDALDCWVDGKPDWLKDFDFKELRDLMKKARRGEISGLEPEFLSKHLEKDTMAAAAEIAKKIQGVKGTDKHRALCNQVSKGLADITRKIPEVLGEVRAKETSGGLVVWDVAIKEDSGFTAAELSEEAGNVGLRLLHSSSRNTVTFVAPLPESTVADALFKFKKAVLNQKLAAMAKAGTWVKKKGEALDSDDGDEWDRRDDASFGGGDQGGASNENCINGSSDGEKDSEEWGEDACISDVGKDDGDFMQAIAASIADLKVASNLEIEGPNTNKVDVSMPMPDVSDELNQKPSSLEEKDALDRACKENEANTFSILNAGPRGFGENI
jgi:hypothetical protein